MKEKIRLVRKQERKEARLKRHLDKTTLPQGEVAWAESSIFQFTNKPKYNPDQLIGRKGFRIYRKMMIDEQVKAVVKFKRDAITSREIMFELDEEAQEKLGDDESKRRINLSRTYIKRMQGSLIDAMNGILTGVWQGVSYTEKNFIQIEFDNKTYWGIGTLKLKPFDTFQFIVDEFGNNEKLVQKINGKEQEIDIDKFIHFVQNREYDEQYGQSDLREAYRAWFSKDMAITFYNMYLERSASGFKWITTKATNGSTAYEALKTVLTNTVNGAGMILGEGDALNIEFPKSKSEFKEAISMHDLAISRAMLVPNLLGITPVDSKGGSRALGETQMEAFLWTLDQEATRLQEILNEQLFRQLGEVNFGDEYWPRLVFQPISETRKMAILNIWKELVIAGAVKHSDSDEKHVRELLEFPEIDEESANDNSDNGKTDSDNPTDDEIKKEEEEKKKTGEEDKIAASTKLILARAMQRVEFRVIQRATETMEDRQAATITPITFDMTQDAVNQVREFYAKGDLEDRQLKVKFNAKDKAKLQRRIDTALQDDWNLGQRHAEDEIDKAKGLAFSLDVNRKRLQFISKEFFKIKSFRVAGKMSDDILAIISQQISNGVKGGKTFKTIEEDIYKAVGGAGYLSKEDYRQALGAAIDPNLKNPQATINTMLRTNGFEAINEARYSYFTDPQLNGFVEALEYSAIMDNVTTQICQHLDGRTYATNAPEWASYRPPNHFNCRSLLMAVTQVDQWTESVEPTVEPQKGFA